MGSFIKTSVICKVPAGSADTFDCAVPWSDPSFIVGLFHLNSLPAGVLTGFSRISRFAGSLSQMVFVWPSNIIGSG